jgi:hypothetical protein
MDRIEYLKSQKIILKIARILLKRSCSNWTWEMANSILQTRYLKEAEELYKILVAEKIIIDEK